MLTCRLGFSFPVLSTCRIERSVYRCRPPRLYVRAISSSRVSCFGFTFAKLLHFAISLSAYVRLCPSFNFSPIYFNSSASPPAPSPKGRGVITLNGENFNHKGYLLPSPLERGRGWGFNQLIAAGYQASQRKLPPRVVKYLMEFYGIER